MSSTASPPCLEHTLNKDGIEDVDRYGRTSLMLAASDGHVGCVKALLATVMADGGSNNSNNINAINREDKNGATAFMLAAKGGHVDCAKCLLDTGLIDDINKMNCFGETAFMLALTHDHLECGVYLLGTGLIDKDEVNKADDDGFTPLMMTAGCGQVEFVKFLLDSGLIDDVNAATAEGYTALMLASLEGHSEVVKCLLDTRRTVDINKAGNGSRSTRMVTSRNIQVECFKCLLAADLVDDVINKVNCDTDAALMLASKNSNVECAKCLTDKGLINVVNQTSGNGRMALLLAATNSHVEFVKYLLSTGLMDGANETDWSNWSTALIEASNSGHVECVKDLLSTELEDSKKAVLMLAFENGRLNCIKCLMKAGLVDEIGKENITGSKTTCVASSDQFECARSLLNTRLLCDVNKEDSSGQTALMIAARKGHAEVAKSLLRTGLIDNLCKKDSCGDTAFNLAAIGGHTDCLRCFLDIVVTNEIPARDAGRDISSSSLFTPNDPVTGFTYAPGIKWESPYVYNRADQGQSSLLKLTFASGLARCVVCFLLGNLDVPLAQHCVCQHDGLEYSTPTQNDHETKEIKPLRIKLRNIEENVVNYVLQCERIRFHTLVALLQEKYERTRQIPLGLYNRLCCLISDYGQVDCFLRLFCEGGHPNRCVDFLLSAFICQISEDGESLLSKARKQLDTKCLETLLKHIFIQDGYPLPGSIRAVFDELSVIESPRVKILYLLEECKDEQLNLFLRNGVFCWSWYGEFRDLRRLARALVTNGYSPSEFVGHGLPTSPLYHAFLMKDAGLVRYLLSNLYLTSNDIFRFQRCRTMRSFVQDDGLENLQSLHRAIVGTPWKLKFLSLVKVSTLLRCIARREDTAPVDSLPIPQVLKRMLSFGHPNGMVEMAHWDSIDVDLV